LRIATARGVSDAFWRVPEGDVVDPCRSKDSVMPRGTRIAGRFVAVLAGHMAENERCNRQVSEL